MALFDKIKKISEKIFPGSEIPGESRIWDKRKAEQPYKQPWKKPNKPWRRVDDDNVSSETTPYNKEPYNRENDMNDLYTELSKAFNKTKNIEIVLLAKDFEYHKCSRCKRNYLSVFIYMNDEDGLLFIKCPFCAFCEATNRPFHNEMANDETHFYYMTKLVPKERLEQIESVEDEDGEIRAAYKLAGIENGPIFYSPKRKDTIAVFIFKNPDADFVTVEISPRFLQDKKICNAFVELVAYAKDHEKKGIIGYGF